MPLCVHIYEVGNTFAMVTCWEKMISLLCTLMSVACLWCLGPSICVCMYVSAMGSVCLCVCVCVCLMCLSEWLCLSILCASVICVSYPLVPLLHVCVCHILWYHCYMYVGLQGHAFQSVWQPGHELMGVMLHEAVVGGV